MNCQLVILTVFFVTSLLNPCVSLGAHPSTLPIEGLDWELQEMGYWIVDRHTYDSHPAIHSRILTVTDAKRDRVLLYPLSSVSLEPRWLARFVERSYIFGVNGWLMRTCALVALRCELAAMHSAVDKQGKHQCWVRLISQLDKILDHENNATVMMEFELLRKAFSKEVGQN